MDGAKPKHKTKQYVLHQVHVQKPERDLNTGSTLVEKGRWVKLTAGKQRR